MIGPLCNEISSKETGISSGTLMVPSVPVRLPPKRRVSKSVFAQTEAIEEFLLKRHVPLGS